MAVLETQQQTIVEPADHAVFVATDGRRARRLRQAAVVAGLLAALWLVGLVVGMVGFGSLPGIPLVKGAHADARPAGAVVPAPNASDRAREIRRALAAAAHARQQQLAATAAAHSAATRAAAKRRAVARRAARVPAAKPRQTTAQTPVNPAQRTRGWARKGYTAPRGQLRKVAPPPPPATSQGRHVGPTRVTPAPPPAVPPGQAKQAAEPPPPPPPPKKV